MAEQVASLMTQNQGFFMGLPSSCVRSGTPQKQQQRHLGSRQERTFPGPGQTPQGLLEEAQPGGLTGHPGDLEAARGGHVPAHSDLANELPRPAGGGGAVLKQPTPEHRGRSEAPGNTGRGWPVQPTPAQKTGGAAKAASGGQPGKPTLTYTWLLGANVLITTNAFHGAPCV